MRGPILKNREYRRLLIAFTAVSITIVVFTVVFTGYIRSNLNRELINNNIAVMGHIVDKHPELEKDIVGYFTKGLDEADAEKAVNIALKYGYTDEIPFYSTPIAKSLPNQFAVIISVVTVFGMVILLYSIYAAFNRLYGSLSDLSFGAEKIMRGNFDIKFPEEGEGELPILGFQFNQMSKRLQLTLEELKSEKEMLKNMLSDISHQIKTPLSSVRMFNELLLEGAVDKPEERQEFLEKSVAQLDRMEWLVLTMLKLSRLEAGVIEFNRNHSDLAGTLKEVVNNLDSAWKAKRQKLITAPEVPVVIFPHDRDWMSEALENIVKNAIDYTPEGGEIRLDIGETDSTIVLTVEDSGAGISPEDIPHIFKRFYQGKNIANLSRKGSGIGLALSKLIVEKHGGLIQVKSVLSRGTTFAITFPRR